MAVHQCAHFCNNMRLVNERTIRLISKYLTGTSTYVDLSDGNQRFTTCGVFYKPDIGKCIKCYLDSNFAGGWDQSDADNAENVMSRTGYVILYVVCTVLYCECYRQKWLKVQKEQNILR